MNLTGAVPIVRPFSGPDVPCPICHNHGASMSYAWMVNLGDLLLRDCFRCHYSWYEHTPPGTGKAPGNYV